MRPRSRAATSAAAIASADSPARSSASCTTTALAFISSRTLLPNSVARAASSALSSRSRTCSGSDSRAPARTNSVWYRSSSHAASPSRARVSRSAYSCSIRAKSRRSSMMASPCADSSGTTCDSICCRSGLVSELVTLKNAADTRCSTRPERSSATRVFSNVGGSGRLAMASTSARCSAMPRSNAGR
ncbi:hypothetical protein [Dactylosporangium cerinum]